MLRRLLSLADAVHEQRIVREGRFMADTPSHSNVTVARDTHGNISNNVYGLSLQQCVFVHEVILDATCIDSTYTTSPTISQDFLFTADSDVSDVSSTGFFLDLVLETLIQDDTDSKDISRQVLCDPSTPPTHVLITLQFLYRLIHAKYQLSPTGTILLGLDKILLPILVYGTHIKAETLDVLLDAAFIYRSSSSMHSSLDTDTESIELTLLRRSMAHIHVTLNSILTCPLNQTPSTTAHKRIKALLEWISRIYSRLLVLFTTTTAVQGDTEGRDMILDAIYDTTHIILNSICYYTTTPLRFNGRIDLLRPVTAILLPLLFPVAQGNLSTPYKKIHSLWEFIYFILLHTLRVSSKEEDFVEKKPCRNW